MPTRRTAEEWHALSQFMTTLGFVLCVIGVVFGVLYCVMFVTQPMVKQAPNDAFLMELLKTVLISMISIIGTLVAVGHGSQATALPTAPKTPKPVAQPLSPPPPHEIRKGMQASAVRSRCIFISGLIIGSLDW
jgi:hypothetical protein